jgi:FtsH-binding integral membrane protein
MQVMDQAREMVELRPDGKKAFSFCGGLFICFAAVLSAAYVVLSSMSAYLTIGHVLRAVGLVAIVLLFVSCYGIIFWSVIRRVTWCLSEDGIEM